MMNLQPVTVGELRERIVETVITQPAPWTDDVGPHLDLQPNHSSEVTRAPRALEMGLNHPLLVEKILHTINPRKSEAARARTFISAGAEADESHLCLSFRLLRRGSSVIVVAASR
jgi:hypothetical protein